MHLNSEFAAIMREWAEWYVRDVLDFRKGDLAWQKVCVGYEGKGTTCSFLPHYMLSELMVSPKNFSKGVHNNVRTLVNRDDLSISSKMMAGDGISSITHSAAFVKCVAGTKARPMTGDIVVIQTEPYAQSKEHTFVFLSEVSALVWQTAESGQARPGDPNGTLDGTVKHRAMTMKNGRLHAAAGDSMPERYVQGWLDLSKLDFTTTDWF